jgi:hypothetical protein
LLCVESSETHSNWNDTRIENNYYYGQPNLYNICLK